MQANQELTGAAGAGSTAGRRRKSRKREAIIGAAKDMFFREGYAGASMDRITSLAGVSKATIYNHFRSKEELLIAVVEAVVLPLQSDYASALDDHAPLGTWLIQLGHLLVHQILLPDLSALARLVIAEAPRLPKIGQIFERIAVYSSLEALKPRLDQAVREHELRPCDTMTALRHFAEMAAGPLQYKMLLNVENLPAEAEIRQHVADVTEVFLHGYSLR